MATARCFKVHPDDNVATLLEDAQPGPLELVGSGEDLSARTTISLGHKVALSAIPPGGAVVKFGVSIGRATAAIHPGDWVHLHNVESNYDPRAGHLDVTTGAPMDTIYE